MGQMCFLLLKHMPAPVSAHFKYPNGVLLTSSWGLGILSLEGTDMVPEIDFRDSRRFHNREHELEEEFPLLSFRPFSLTVTHGEDEGMEHGAACRDSNHF